MDEQSFLLTISELSLGVVGFSAIVAALIRGRSAAESEYESLLINGMVEFGFAALLFSLLPFIIDFFGVDTTWNLRVSNSAMFFFFVSYFPTYQRRRSRALLGSGAQPPQWNFRARLAVTYLIGATALLSGWALIPVEPFAAYALGIAWLLFLAALGFLFTIRQVRRQHR